MKNLIYTLTLILFTLIVNGQTVQELDELGYQAMVDKDFSKGIDYYTKAIVSDSKQSRLFHNRGICYSFIGEYQKAMDDYNRALSIDKTAAIYNSLGLIYLNLVNYTEAIKYFNLALSMDKEDEEVYYNIAYSFGNLKKYEEALTYFDSALKINPSHLFSLHGRALTYMTLEKYSEALTDLNSLNKINPSDLEIIRLRSTCYYELNNYLFAINDYTTLLSNDSTNFSLLAQRAECYSITKNYNQAIKDYTSILDVVKLSGEQSLIATAYYYRGKVYFDMGSHKFAINDFSENLKINPEDKVSYFFRAISKIKLGDKLGSCLDYAEANKLGFKNSDEYNLIMQYYPAYLEEIIKECN